MRQWDNGPTLYAWTIDTSGQIRLLGANGFFVTGEWVHVAFTYDKVTGSGRLYRNGVLVSEQDLGIITMQTSYDFNVGATRLNENMFKGRLDEISLYRRPLSITEIAAIYESGTVGKAPPDNNLPPVVSAGPDVILSGVGAATLTGSVTDDNKPFGPPTTQWSLEAGPAGGTVSFADAGAVATTATVNMAGTYLIRLTANDGYATAVSDLMEIRVGSAAVSPVAGLAAWWPGNAHPREVVSGNADLEFFNGATYAEGQVLQGFDFDGVDDQARAEAHPDIDIGASADGLTIELWARPTQEKDVPLVQWATPSAEGVSLREWGYGEGLYAFLTDTSGGQHVFGTGNVFDANTWVHVAVTYDKVTGIARLYRNHTADHL